MNLLVAAVQRRYKLPVSQMFDGLLNEIRDFSAGQQFDDDVQNPVALRFHIAADRFNARHLRTPPCRR